MPKPYVHVANVGHCVILAQYLGEDFDGKPIPSFFAGYCIGLDGRPVSFAKGCDVCRISRNRNTYAELVSFCHGYLAAASERTGRTEWRYGSFFADQVETPDSEELARLKAWPNLPEPIATDNLVV